MKLPLFVYGTLMTGQVRADMLGGLARKEATASGKLWRMPAGYPALEQLPRGTVHGELVDPPGDKILGLLDLYEGVAEGLYRRTKLEVVVGLRKVLAWAYVMDEPARRGGKLIRSGRFRAVRRDA